RVRGQEAGVATVADGVVEDVHRIVRRAAAGRRAVRDESRVADAARVHAEAAVVVVAEQLAGDLGDAVHRGRALDRVLRRAVPRRAGPERADRAGREDRAAALALGLEH